MAQILMALLIISFNVPLSNNTDGISRHPLDRAYIISFALLAMVAAPIVEELVFRGLIMRGLRSVFPAWLSVGLQGILFGAAHFDPVRGMGNIGLVMILSAVGVVLGGAAYLIRRIAPTMIAHAIFNSLVFVLLITR
jgi:membrane protease YdiL (CAAX protease family)